MTQRGRRHRYNRRAQAHGASRRRARRRRSGSTAVVVGGVAGCVYLDRGFLLSTGDGGATGYGTGRQGDGSDDAPKWATARDRGAAGMAVVVWRSGAGRRPYGAVELCEVRLGILFFFMRETGKVE
jgi:hypothetical protein